MALIGSVVNQGTLQGQINDANGFLTGIISNAGLLGGQVVAERGLKGDKGDTGDTGATGNGIVSVAYVSSVGLVDTYKITYTNGNETTFTVTNGQDGNDGHSPVVTATKSGKKTYISVDGTQIAEVDDGADGTNGTNGVGISSIAKTSTAGKVDTYTITYTNGNTATFTVTNGNDGASGHSPVVTASKAGKTTTLSVDGTAIATILDGNDGNSPTITTSKTGKTTTILSDGTSIGTVLDGNDGNSPVITTSKTGGTTTIYSDGISIGTVDDGDKGDTPVITASKTGKVTTIYADGVSIATINDGTDGADGIVQDVTVNGTSVLDGTTAKVLVPTKTSDLNNDSLFARGHIGAFHGTCTSSASATTKVVTCADFTASDLVAGAMIVVSFSNTNSGAVADLKLDVNGTGAYAIKQNSSGTLSNLGDKGYLKASSYPFIFNGSYWICWYDTNTNTIGYTIRTNGHTLPVKTACYRYRICFTSPDGKNYIPANASTSTSATASKTVTTEKIDPFGRIIYYSYTTAISANGTIGASYQMQQYNGVTLGYSFNRTGAALTMTTNKPVYVTCDPQTDGSAIIDGTTPFVQDLPTTEDGKIYIFIGVATSATAIEFTLEHPVYCYKNGHIQLYTNADANVQSDWNEADNTKDDYIKNKPTIPANTSDLVNDSGFITSSDIPSIPTITDTYDGTSSDGMSGKAVKSAIDSLDGTVSGTAGSSKTLTAFSQTDGKVSATFGNISITKSQVSDFAHTHTKSDVTDFTHSHTKSDITDFPTIPTDTGDLTNGAGFITSSDIPVTDVEVNGTSVVTSGVAEVTVPAKLGDLTNDMDVSDFPNDAGYLTSAHEVPSGGTSGQVLAKNSNTDYDLKWVNQSGGGTFTAVEMTQSDYDALSSAQKQLDVLYLINDLAGGGGND